MDKLPNTVSALIKQLDSETPHVRPRPGMSIEDLMFKAGQRALVEKLVNLLDPSKD